MPTHIHEVTPTPRGHTRPKLVTALVRFTPVTLADQTLLRGGSARTSRTFLCSLIDQIARGRAGCPSENPTQVLKRIAIGWVFTQRMYDDAAARHGFPGSFGRTRVHVHKCPLLPSPLFSSRRADPRRCEQCCGSWPLT